MNRLEVLEKEVMGLNEAERASLACLLLGSLPPILTDEDEGVSEAIQRNAELEQGLDGVSWEDLCKNLGRG